MILNKKLIVVIPAGRRRYMSILMSYLLKVDIIDEIRLWINTKNEDDIKYINWLNKKYKKIKLDNSVDDHDDKGSSLVIPLFFRNCCEKDAIYIRFDDDIVFIEDGFIEEISKFRIENPEYFLVLGNIINNVICDHIHIKNKALSTNHDIKFNCDDEIGWGDPNFAYQKHCNFIEKYENNDIEKFKFDNMVLDSYDRFSINCISWLGSEFEKFNGNVKYGDEEIWLTSVKNRQLNMPNVIYGKKICSHFSFFTQRDFLDTTNILKKYKNISKNKNNI